MIQRIFFADSDHLKPLMPSLTIDPKMLILLKLAARNVLRNKRRSAITLVGTGLGLALLLVVNGFITGSEDQLVNNFIAAEGGHIQINAQGYAAKARFLPLDIAISDPDQLAQQVAKIAHVTQVLQRIRFRALMGTGTDSTPALGVAIQPEAERDGIVAQSLIAGSFIDDQPGYALVGKQVAEDLKLQVGSIVTIVSNTPSGALNADDVEIKGIFYTGFPQYDSGTIIVSMQEAQRLLRLKGKVTEINVTVNDVGRTDQVAEVIRQGDDSFEVKTWRDLGQALWQLLDARRKIFDFISIIVLAIAALGMANTMLMSVFERTREIGTLMALGSTRSEILTLFLLESLLLGIVGGLMGALVGGSVVNYFATVGVSFGEGVSSLTSVPVGQKIFARFSLTEVARLFGFVQLLSMLAAFYPAWLASRQEPVAALRHV